MTELTLQRDKLPHLSYTYRSGTKNICILYLHGWTAQRKSVKGQALESVAEQAGCHYLALDYTGHGDSGGILADFTVGQGIQDTLDVIRATVPDTPLLIVGNSIGGWIGLTIAEQLKQTKAFLGLAPAPDITQFIWDTMLPDTAKDALIQGDVLGPSSETKGFCFTKQLFDDAKAHIMLDRQIDFDGPARLIVGDNDEHVTFNRILKIKDNLKSQNVTITLIKGADHHLSTPTDLSVIQKTLTTLLAEVS